MKNLNSLQAGWLTEATAAVFPSAAEPQFISGISPTAKADTAVLDRAIADLQAVQAKAFAGITWLGEALVKAFIDDGEQQGALSAAVERLRGLASRMNDGGLAATLGGVSRAPAETQIKSALGLVGEWVDFASTDVLMQEIDDNAPSPVVRPFMEHLGEVKRILTDMSGLVLL